MKHAFEKKKGATVF